MYYFLCIKVNNFDFKDAQQSTIGKGLLTNNPKIFLSEPWKKIEDIENEAII